MLSNDVGERKTSLGLEDKMELAEVRIRAKESVKRQEKENSEIRRERTLRSQGERECHCLNGR